MKVPILSGVFTDLAGDIRAAYPRNLVPVVEQSGINTGYLRPAPGIVRAYEPSPVDGPILDRGGVIWRGTQYRVRGNSLWRVLTPSNTLSLIGALVGASTTNPRPASFAVGFDRIAIAADDRLYYYDGINVTQVTDVDLGLVLDVVWTGGYFMTTDGEFIVTTELLDPTSISPLKYESAEFDPDPIRALGVLRNEVFVFGQYTTEVFQNVGGAGFPFARVQGAQVPKGVINKDARAVLGDAWVIVGGGRGEAVSVWALNGGAAQRIATREIERMLNRLPEATLLFEVTIQSRRNLGREWLYLHLPDRTMVFDLTTSVETGQQVWFELGSTLAGPGRYNARNGLQVGPDWWWARDDGVLGIEVDTLGTHWGEHVGWQVDTQALYGDGRAAIVHEIELVALQGRAPAGVDASIWNSYSDDGLSWSNERPVRTARAGQTTRRLAWRGQGMMRHWRIQRFRGTSESHTTLVRLEMGVEPLAA